MSLYNRVFTPGGQESGSVLGAAVCNRQAIKEVLIESLPLMTKDKRKYFFQNIKKSAVELPLDHTLMFWEDDIKLTFRNHLQFFRDCQSC